MNERLVPRHEPQEAAQVVALPPVQLVPVNQVAAQLRLLADRMDQGLLGQVIGAAVVVERPYAEVPLVGGYGSAEHPLCSLGLLHLGLQRLGAAVLTGTVRTEV